MALSTGTAVMAEFTNGDYRGFRGIYSLFQPSLHKYAYAITREKAAAGDIVTDVFIKLWLKHRDFGSLENVKAFLFISTRNASMNYARKANGNEHEQLGLVRHFSGDYQEYVLTRIIRREIFCQLDKAVETIPDQARKVFKMYYVDGLRNMEIARQLRLSINTIKNHKVRAIRILKNRFPEKSQLY
jgi:RNA polymerase sigma-70 factor (family 1)